jgi:acetyl esterase/lipase
MKTFLILCSLFLFASCNTIDIVPLINKDYSITDAESTKVDYEEKKNVSYGDNELQKYDLYLPKNQTDKVPVIVMFHGGGWSEGDKGFINPMVDYFRQKNVKCAIVNANYRLTFQKGITYREQLADIGLLLKKLQNEAKSLNITPKFFLMGISSGAHLALLYAYSSDSNKLVEVVGGIAAPIDLTSASLRKDRMNTDIIKLIGKPFEGNIEEYRNASPYFQIKRASPPTILFYGGSDNLVPANQGTLIHGKLTELDINQEYYFYPEQSHDWSKLSETLDKMIVFADKYL